MATIATRRERVLLELETNFPAEAAKAAAAVALLNEEVNRLGGGRSRSSLKTIGNDIEDTGRRADRAAPSIDKFSGRVNLLAKSVAAIGPSIVPISAVAIPALTGLASSFGFAAIAGGTMIGAFQGIGDALKAVNKAAIEPTAANIDAARLAMKQISPEARKFVKELRSFQPELKHLRDTAAAGMFPGMAEGLDQLSGALPKVERIVAAVSGELGDIASSTGKSLGGERWTEFFDFLAAEAPKALSDMASGIGNVAHAFAELWMAFGPLNSSFSSWLVHSTADLDKWASGLSKTQGFQEFVAYIQTNGPQVAATMGAIANAVLQIVEAAAPIGGPVLKGIEGLANAIAKIADSDIGTPLFGMVAALSALNLAMTAGRSISTKFTGSQASLTSSFEKQRSSLRGLAADYAAIRRDNKSPQTMFAAGKDGTRQISAVANETERFNKTLRETAVQAGKAGALVGALGLITTGAADKFGIANTATLALAGSFIGPWGTAAGAAVGATLDLVHANDSLNDSLAQLNAMAGKVDFATFNDKISKTQKQIDDLKHVTGVGDWFSDTGKVLGGALRGHTVNSQIADKQGKLDATEAKNDMALRERGAAVANQQMAASSQLAAQGFHATAAGAREASMSVAQFTASMQGASDALQRMSNWDTFRGAVLDAQDAVAKAGTTLKKNGDIIRGQGRDMQRAGLESRGQLRNIAAQAIQTSEGMKNVANRTKFLDGARDKFLQIARAMGLSGPAARRMAAGFGLIDRGAKGSGDSVKSLQAKINSLKGKIVDAKAKGAKESSPEVQKLRAAIASLKDKIVKVKQQGAAEAQAAINGVHGSTVVITVRRNFVGGPHAVARGGLFMNDVRTYALGDIANRHQPELAGPGPTRIWREPETMGEAYIPLANDDRRPRARAIAAETVSLLGGTAHFASGGLVRRHPNRHDNNDDNAHHVNKFAQALKEATRSINREKAARDALISKRDDLRSSVSGNFLSDPFAGGNVWAAGGGNPTAILKADTAKANAFKSTLYMLRKQGLTGDALASIASTGNIGQAQALLAGGKAGIGQFQSAYAQRAHAAAAVGAFAGSAAYGAQIATQTKHLATLAHEVKALKAQLAHQHKAAQRNHKANADHTAKGVAKGVNGAASRAKRRSR